VTRDDEEDDDDNNNNNNNNSELYILFQQLFHTNKRWLLNQTRFGHHSAIITDTVHVYGSMTFCLYKTRN
jgi:hypothetical protein